MTHGGILIYPKGMAPHILNTDRGHTISPIEKSTQGC